MTVTFYEIMNLLAETAYMKRYVFENALSWVLAATKFLMAMHYFACGWIYIHYRKKARDEQYVSF